MYVFDVRKVKNYVICIWPSNNLRMSIDKKWLGEYLKLMIMGNQQNPDIQW